MEASAESGTVGGKPQELKAGVRGALIAFAGSEEAAEQQLLTGNFQVDASWLYKQLWKFNNDLASALVQALGAKPGTAPSTHHVQTATATPGSDIPAPKTPYFKLKEMNPVLQLKFSRHASDGRFETQANYDFQDFGLGGETKVDAIQIPRDAIQNEILGALLPAKLTLGLKFESKLLEAAQAWMARSSDHHGEGHGEEEKKSVCEIGFSVSVGLLNDKVQAKGELSAIKIQIGESGFESGEEPGEIKLAFQFNDIVVSTFKIGQSLLVDAKLTAGVEFVFEPDWERLLDPIKSWAERCVVAAADAGAIDALAIIGTAAVITYGAWIAYEEASISHSIDEWDDPKHYNESLEVLLRGAEYGYTSTGATPDAGTGFEIGRRVGEAYRLAVGFDPKDQSTWESTPSAAEVKETMRAALSDGEEESPGSKLLRYVTFDRWFQYATATFKKPTEEDARTGWKTIAMTAGALKADPVASHLDEAERRFFEKVTGYKPLRTL